MVLFRYVTVDSYVGCRLHPGFSTREGLLDREHLEVYSWAGISDFYPYVQEVETLELVSVNRRDSDSIVDILPWFLWVYERTLRDSNEYCRPC